MRTALILLLLLAVGAVAGSLIPQVGISDDKISQMFVDHPLRATVYEATGLFDVYGSWWFTLIYALLLTSLAACLFPRTRALLRTLRTRPQPARELDSMRLYVERSVAVPPGTVLDRSANILRRKRFRVDRVGGAVPQVAADKGIAREAGSLLFHWAFFLIVIGIFYGKGTGFTGYAVIPEGTTWTEAHANYDGTAREGRFFNENHTGAQVRVEEFTVVYEPDGTPQEFTTTAELLHGDGTSAGTADIELNAPGSVDGVDFYQYGYGWAPVIEVTDADGEILFSGPVIFEQDRAPKGISQAAMPWTGAVKLPSLRPQVGVAFRLLPDPETALVSEMTDEPIPVLKPSHPVLALRVFEGDLRLDVAQRVTELDPVGLQERRSGIVPLGEDVRIGGGVTVSFPELREYTVLQVGRDAGVGIMLLAAILILGGLLPALYSSRRRVWVRADPAPHGSVLKVGGFALQRRSEFEEEFARLVEAMARATDHASAIESETERT
ncbi:MAG: cytochrome c biogenesis protein ResB [Actinomycetota bacterium]